MEGATLFSGVLGIILIVLAILALLMPFFVFQIRDQTKAINKKLSILIDILQKEAVPEGETSATVPRVEVDKKGRKIKICAKCGGKNRAEDWKCVHCGVALI